MNFIKSMWTNIIQSWNAFWETYETTYANAYGIAPTGFYDPFLFNYFGDPCFPPFYYIPYYYQTQNEE